jgi:hypothetical protein
VLLDPCVDVFLPVAEMTSYADSTRPGALGPPLVDGLDWDAEVVGHVLRVAELSGHGFSDLEIRSEHFADF